MLEQWVSMSKSVEGVISSTHTMYDPIVEPKGVIEQQDDNTLVNDDSFSLSLNLSILTPTQQ